MGDGGRAVGVGAGGFEEGSGGAVLELVETSSEGVVA